MPRFLGQSQILPGAIDVELDDGQVLQMDPSMPEVQQAFPEQLGGPGASAPIADAGAFNLAGAMDAFNAQNAPPQQTTIVSDVTGGLNPLSGVGQGPGVRGPDPELAARAQAAAVPQQPAQAAPPAAGIFNDAPGGVPAAASTSPLRSSEGSLDLINQLTGGALSGRPRGGGGGPLTRTTSTLQRQFSAPATPEQAAEMARLGSEAQAAEEAVIGAREAQTGAQEAQLTHQSLARRQLNQELESIEQERQQSRTQQQERIGRQREVIDKKREELARMEIDPERLFEEKGVGGTILAAIASGLGAVGAALSGGPNTAAQIIQGAIDRDIASQREAIRRGEVEAEQLQTVYGDLVGELGNIDQAALAARELAFDHANRELQSFADASQAADVRANFEEMSALFEAERARSAQAGLQQQIGTISVEEEQRQRRGGGGGRRGLSVNDAIKVLEFAREAEATQGGLDPNQHATALERYGERRREIEAAQDSVARVLSRAEGDRLPGVGRGQQIAEAVGSTLPAALVGPAGLLAGETSEAAGRQVGRLTAGEEGRDVQADLGMAVERTIQAITGATATDEQRNAVRQFYGLGPGASEADVVRGLRRAQQDLDRDVRDLNAAAPSSVVQEFEQRRHFGQGARGRTFTPGRLPGD